MRCSEAAKGYLRLLSIRGIGVKTGRQLVSACGGIEELWRSPAATLERIEGVSPRLVAALQNSVAGTSDTIIEQCRRHAVDILSIEDEEYPEQLRTCDDAPLILYLRGDIQALNSPRMLAVVGARKASREGRLIARRWSAHLARAGVTIVSGMAYGVDAAAHGGALEGGGKTVAVLGCGIGRLAGTQLRQAEAIAERGCVVSEYPPETEARAEHFPQRNRIIAGLCAASVVIEAGIRSGSMITAGQALGYGREVLAVPGSVLTDAYAGCHQLIRDGAELVASAETILTLLGWLNRAPSPFETYIPATATEEKIIELLRQEIMHLDSLAVACNLTVPELSPCLLALELQGVIERLPGSRFTLGGKN